MTSETPQPMSLTCSRESLTDLETVHVGLEPSSGAKASAAGPDRSEIDKAVTVHYDKHTSTSHSTTLKTPENTSYSHAPGSQDDLVESECQSLTTREVSGMSYLQEDGLQDTAESMTGPMLSVRMLMSSRDVGSIIGKGGMTIKAFRETSGARINISNSTSSERLVQITGDRESISKAFAAISKKIEIDTIVARQTETQTTGQPDLPEESKEGDLNSPPNISFRLVIQTSQCGSLIGKGGSKIKEIRETTGASIQVAGETLPNSTERSVIISGTPESLTMCISQMCHIMMDNPPRGPNIPYKPHSLPNQAYQPRASLPYQTPYTATFHTSAGPATTTQTMRIPNDLIGCVIGRKGSKIHEIRVSSGAQIKIAGNEGDSHDRLVTITGTPEAVGLAQYFINSRIHTEVNTFISVGLNM